jgi:hypothetical protein
MNFPYSILTRSVSLFFFFPLFLGDEGGGRGIFPIKIYLLEYDSTLKLKKI